MINTAAFIAAAESYIGTPFKHQGRLPGVGLDCAGLIVCALRAAGHDVQDMAGYGRIPAQGLLLRMVEAHADRIAVADLQDGDICVFRFRSDPQHLAIYVAGRLIHAWQEVRIVVTHDMDDTWRQRLVGCYRVRD